MKKVSFFLILILLCFTIFAQEIDDNSQNNQSDSAQNTVLLNSETTDSETQNKPDEIKIAKSGFAEIPPTKRPKPIDSEKTKKAPSDMGFNYVSEVLTPDSEAASEDAEVSVADIFSFVKNHDGNYEANSAYPVHFSPRKANPLFLNEDGTPKVFYHGSKKNGGFTVFRDWQYFTEQKRYAERYAERGNQKSLYEVYLTADKVFDTRDEYAARIFESIRQEYGLGELQDTGLPDWTDGYDITEYLTSDA